MSDRREAAIGVASEMLSPEIAQGMAKAGSSGMFGGYLGELALDNVFGSIWTRPGLARRDRSLVTLGILIALRGEEELRFHIPAALKNGITREEIEEVLYQASAYAGFPAAASARKLAAEILDGAAG